MENSASYKVKLPAVISACNPPNCSGSMSVSINETCYSEEKTLHRQLEIQVLRTRPGGWKTRCPSTILVACAFPPQMVTQWVGRRGEGWLSIKLVPRNTNTMWSKLMYCVTHTTTQLWGGVEVKMILNISTRMRIEQVCYEEEAHDMWWELTWIDVSTLRSQAVGRKKRAQEGCTQFSSLISLPSSLHYQSWIFIFVNFFESHPKLFFHWRELT